ncbi:MAG: hypothetical protein ACFB3T_15200 [Geminicoccaceae bacterium]
MSHRMTIAEVHRWRATHSPLAPSGLPRPEQIAMGVQRGKAERSAFVAGLFAKLLCPRPKRPVAREALAA